MVLLLEREDEWHGLVCPSCGCEVEDEDARWYQKVAFCKRCLPTREKRSKPQPPPSPARLKLREKLRGLT